MSIDSVDRNLSLTFHFIAASSNIHNIMQKKKKKKFTGSIQPGLGQESGSETERTKPASHSVVFLVLRIDLLFCLE